MIDVWTLLYLVVGLLIGALHWAALNGDLRHILDKEANQLVAINKHIKRHGSPIVKLKAWGITFCMLVIAVFAWPLIIAYGAWLVFRPNDKAPPR